MEMFYFLFLTYKKIDDNRKFTRLSTKNIIQYGLGFVYFISTIPVIGFIALLIWALGDEIFIEKIGLEVCF